MMYQDALQSILTSYQQGRINYNTKLLSLGFLSVLEQGPLDYESMAFMMQRPEPGIRSVIRNYIKRNLVEVVEKRSSTHGGRRCNCYGLTPKGQQLLSAYQRTQQTQSTTRRAEIYQELRDEHPDRTFSCIALLAATELTDGCASALLAAMQVNAPALMQQTTRAIEADLLCICGYETSPDGGRERRVALTPDGKRLLYLMLQI